MREKYDRQFHVQINKNGFWRQLTSKASQASASESRVLAKKNTRKVSSHRFQDTNVISKFPHCLSGNFRFTQTNKNHQNLHLTLQWPNTLTDQSTPFLEFQISNQNPLFAHVAVTSSQPIWPFFFFFFFSWAPHTHTHSYRLSAIFSLRINFTALASLSLLKRSIKRRIRVLSAIDSLPTPTTILLFSVSPFIQLLQLLFSTNIVCLFVCLFDWWDLLVDFGEKFVNVLWLY